MEEDEKKTQVYQGGFSARSFEGVCDCGLKLKDHPICQACGALAGTQHEQVLSVFREHNLCGVCQDRWPDLDKRLGREATWGEMLKGLHPNQGSGRYKKWKKDLHSVRTMRSQEKP